MNEKNDSTIEQNRVFQEIISTETTYNNALILLENVLDQQGLISSDVLLQKIKEQISTLRFISSQILNNLQTAIKKETTDEHRQQLNHQRPQLLKAFYQAYSPYVTLYNAFLTKVATSPESYVAVDKALKATGTSLNLSAHLIMPVQRGPRYMLLVKALKGSKQLEQKHLDELKELDSLVARCLEKANAKEAPAPGYQLGDGLRFIWSNIPSLSVETAADDDSYQFGDYTRRFFGKSRDTNAEKEALVITKPTPGSE